nr:hypothetical protein [Tanacetum cinerariifolium]
ALGEHHVVVHPNHELPKARILDNAILLKVAAADELLVVGAFGVGGNGVEQLRAVVGQRFAVVGIRLAHQRRVELRRACLAVLGRDEDHAVGPARTVNSRGRSVLQNFGRLNISGQQKADVAGLNTIYHVQRVAVVDGAHAPHPNAGARAGLPAVRGRYSLVVAKAPPSYPVGERYWPGNPYCE